METHHQEAPFLYFSSTDEGVLVEVNETLCRYLNYTRDELLGQKAEIIFTIPTRIFQQTHFFPLLKMQGHAEEIFMTLQTKEKKQVPVLINAIRNLENGNGLSIYGGIVVNNRKKFEDELVAARKAAEKALADNTDLMQAKEELQQQAELLDQQMFMVSKQNEELRQFNHVVTHELQEPLRKLFIFTNMLLESTQVSENSKIVGKVKAVLEQMRNILSGLQQYVWLTETSVKKTTINLNVLITDILNLLQKEQPGCPLTYSIEKLPDVVADKEQVRFLLQEIFSNAIRFRKEGEGVTLSVTGSQLQRNKYRTVDGKYEFMPFLKLQIADNGVGFDAVYKDQVFGLFKRLHPVSGRGVGLSLCKQIVENHQGSIQLDSRVGEGTSVNILLPLWAEKVLSSDNNHYESIENSNKQ